MKYFITQVTLIKKYLWCSMFILFSLNVSAQVMETEPNDDMSTANTIPSDTMITAAICPGSETDFFRIILPDDGVLMVNTEATQTNFNMNAPVGLQFGLFDKSGGYMNGYNVPTDTTAGVYASGSFSYSCIAADTFYIRVNSGVFTYECIDYNFTFTVETPVFSNDPEPNDNLASAVFFEAGTSQPGHFGFYGSGGGVDDYKIFKPDTGDLYLEVQSSHAAEDLTTQILIGLYDQAGGYLGGNNFFVGAENNIAVDTFILGGTEPDSFYVAVSMSACGSYSLSYPGIITAVGNIAQSVHSILVTPNPSQGIVNFNLNHQSLPGKFELLDITGNVFIVKTSFENPFSFSVDGSSLTTGIYYARILFTDGLTGVEKLVILH